MKKQFLVILLASTGLLFNTHAFNVRITVTNNAASDGLYFTPVWTGFHNGSFDLFDSGSAASPGLESLAEDGMTGTLSTEFGTSNGRLSNVLNQPEGPGPGLFAPGTSSSFDIDLDTTDNRYFSFASMLLPSNDAFIGNGNPEGHEIFNEQGDFNGPITISLLGANIYDAGSEQNDTFGAPFSAIGGTSTDTNGTVALHAGLDNFVGTGLGNSTTLGQAFTSTTPLATLTISAVPEPSSYAAIAGFLSLCFIGFQRRFKRA